MADRRKELAVIHVAKKDLGLADADYRALLSERYGVLTAAALGDAERRDLIAEFERRGFRGSRRDRRQGRDGGMMARIRARLAEAGRPTEYGDALARRICGVDRLDWCTPAMQRKVLAALEKDRRRRALRAEDLPPALAQVVLAHSALERRVLAMYAGALAAPRATPASAMAWVLDTLAEEAERTVRVLEGQPAAEYRSDAQYARDKRGEARRARALASARDLLSLIGRGRRVAG